MSQAFTIGGYVRLKIDNSYGGLPLKAGNIGQISSYQLFLRGVVFTINFRNFGLQVEHEGADMSKYFEAVDPYQQIAASMQPQNKKSFQEEMDEITAIFNDATAKAVKDVISTHSPKDSACDHNGLWMPYHGLVESFEFCTKCDAKRPMEN